ncbi:uncharacterized protein At3g60930, chloroplastic-like [Eutrema salsugineum]|uniref:uncharacterized protein At3g60930, chloroplastic-like n=1 Tax=Eutrema salsugineum TaxID=72664 RepID=UPI000CECF8F3|nr:uncharacterized protein At3g60930, chloroplastic-like [Eutrema salsugineum]
MLNRSDDSLDPLFYYVSSRVDAKVRGVTGSSEASVLPSPSNHSSEGDEASNHSNPSCACSPNNKPSVLTSCSRGSAYIEDIDYAIIKAEEEAFPFDPVEARLELERLMASRGASLSGQGKHKRGRRQKPDPPGATLSSPDSLEALRCRFGMSEAVEFVIPENSDRADKPPENHFTLYEVFFELCFLCFPIPGVILEYLWKHGISIGQIMPRGLRKAPKGGRFYISNKSNRRIIGGFPSKDQFWTARFVYVLVNEASVGEDFVRKTKTAWGPLVPDDLFVVRDTLAARRVNWRKHFTFERVERARAIFAGVPVSTSSSNSSGDTREKMVIITLRDRKRHEEEEAAKRAAEAAQTEAEAIPQDDPPSREGEGVIRAVGANVAEVVEKEVAPEVEPGEIIPEMPKDNSAAHSKTPSNSAILALPKSSRPSASHLQKHDAGQKLSATEKGKGVAVQKNEPPKKKRKPASGDPASRKLVVDDPDASAVMFSRLPPPEQLRRPRSYGAMAQRGTKFVAAINELMAECEADLSKVERRLDEARNETAVAKGKLDEAMTKVKRLEEEKIALHADVDKVSVTVIRLEEARRAKSAKVGLLKRRIEAKDALFDDKVKRAKNEARRELTSKFQERFAKVKEGLAKLEKAKIEENELGQINGNLAMIDDLRKPDGPTLDDEETKLKRSESEYIDDKAYERIASEIRGELVFSPVSPDSVATCLGNEPIEETAANLGVGDPTGSNTGTPALSNLLAERETQSAA